MRWIVGLICVISSLMLSGCGNAADRESAPSPQNQDERIRVLQTVPEKREILNGREVAERLKNLALSVPNVKDAKCVVIGNTAIVGIDVEGGLDRSRVGTIKYSVAEALRKDPYGANAVVTADIDLKSRLREIGKDIRAGRPFGGLAEELSAIVGRIMPEFPKHVPPPGHQQGNPEERRHIKNKSL